MTKPELENKFLEKISDRLDDNELSCEDIRTLSDALANLEKDGYIKEIMQSLNNVYDVSEPKTDEEEKIQKS